MKLNRTDKKSDFIGFKEDPRIAEAFRAAAERDGGVSKVLQDFVRRYLRRKSRAA